MSIRPGRAKGPYVGSTGGGGGSSFTRSNIIEGQATELANIGASDIEVRDGVAGFRDDFTSEKPFWLNKPVITDGTWSIDTVNERLEGLSDGVLKDEFRFGIEGDYDYSMKFTHNTASSCGFYISNAGDTVSSRIVFVDGTSNIDWEVTGETTVSVTPGVTTFWLRQVRRGNTISAYWKANDTDAWTQIGSDVTKELGNNCTAWLDNATGDYITDVFLWDNTFPSRRLVYTLTDAANISLNAAIGNYFEVTLGGNRQLDNPTNPKPGQMIIIRVIQDGTGSRTLTFDTDFNFSTDLPSPTLTTTAAAWDYLGFIYNDTNSSWDYIAEIKGFS